MKLIFAAVAAVVAAISAPASAAAAPAAAPVAAPAPQERVVVRERTTVTRHHYGPRYRWRNVCRTTWHHGDRRRVCRRTRVRW